MRPDEMVVNSSEPRRAAETMSETSEGTATTSVSGKSGFESREELRELAAELDIDPEDLHQERFRVDRRKLEQMLLGDTKSAETFFKAVMDRTNTLVTWPSRLKIGAKSKKDPHIKVAGRLDDVRSAKEKIMEILDTRQNNRVTMKLDVSYTDHSHIIGKGGLTIKRVMEETGCHIHFPDSNRSNHQDKSNQVSIAGEMESVERARARVRNLTPLIFSFELPIMSASQTIPDCTSPCVVKIQEKYNVQVMFRTRPKLHATLVVVKGCEWEVNQVKHATRMLIQYMCKNLASQIQVQMSMEISPQHHSIVLGKQSSNLKMIMQRTSTQIMFPDAGDPNIPSLKKSNVTITGEINNVYLARQQLVGSLPLVLMFDLPEDSVSASVDTEKISQLMQSLDVFINVRHKPKQSTLSVIIKGIERKASNIYKARKQLLGLDEPTVIADIPVTYYIPNAGNVFQSNSNNDSPNNLVSGVPDNFSSMLNVNTQNSPYCVSPMSHSPNSLGLSSHWGLAHHYIPSMCPYPYSHLNHLLTTQHMLHNNMMGASHGPPGLSNHVMPPGIGAFHPNNVPTNFSGIHGLNANSLMDNKDGNSAYSSLSSVSSSLSSPAISPRNISPVNPTDANTNLPDLSSMLSDLPVTDRRAPGCEKKSLEMAAQQNFASFDYEQKKLLATKAMQNKSNSNDFRVPTSAWSGCGLSQSIPLTSDLSKELTSHPSDLWKEPTTPVFSTEIDFSSIISSKDRAGQIGMASNYLDHTPTSYLNKITSSHRFDDLNSMLTSIGLEKYIQMNKRTSPFSGSAAPGAERKASSSSAPTSSMGKCNLEW
ncbi:protein bicaudal C homolog 1-B isoform X2 [Monomorium pharaonis]|uniref:protein bicaudal C homolog 1-B isoform X2 n=1 Tax=Monomorium pharaonis TaxID=307658 RepID=UPI00063EE831|nr:protein bicaudal C homolog 1-B isoform X2 [Monomorium pharaonis]